VPKEVHNEYQDCMCTKTEIIDYVTDSTTTYCSEWQCIDYSRASRDSGGYGYYEYERHVCHERDISGHCKIWDWQTDDYYSFENTRCSCTSSNADGACLTFSCKEKGATKTFPELGWMGWGFGFAIAIGASFYYVPFDDFNLPFWKTVACLVLSFFTIFIVPLLAGGLPTVMFVVVIVPPIFYAFVMFKKDSNDGKLFRKKMVTLSNKLYGLGRCCCPQNGVEPEPEKEVVVATEVELVKNTAQGGSGITAQEIQSQQYMLMQQQMQMMQGQGQYQQMPMQGQGQGQYQQMPMQGQGQGQYQQMQMPQGQQAAPVVPVQAGVYAPAL
jgi:hypothetical protein